MHDIADCIVMQEVRTLLSDQDWEVLKKITSWRSVHLSTRGRPPKDLRKSLEGIFWILRTGSPWRDLPRAFGSWQSVYDRFRCWSHSGLWSHLLAHFENQWADKEYLMVDSSSIRVHQDAARTHRGREVDGMGSSRGGLTTKVHALCDALGYPLAFILTCGQRGDATQGVGLLQKAMSPGCACLLDGGYDSDAIREYVLQEGGTAVIPPRITRTSDIDFDKHTYKERHKVENLFQKLKRFRRVATRYEKHIVLFAAMISIAAILIWIQQ